VLDLWPAKTENDHVCLSNFLGGANRIYRDDSSMWADRDSPVVQFPAWGQPSQKGAVTRKKLEVRPLESWQRGSERSHSDDFLHGRPNRRLPEYTYAAKEKPFRFADPVSKCGLGMRSTGLTEIDFLSSGFESEEDEMKMHGDPPSQHMDSLSERFPLYGQNNTQHGSYFHSEQLGSESPVRPSPHDDSSSRAEEIAFFSPLSRRKSLDLARDSLEPEANVPPTFEGQDDSPSPLAPKVLRPPRDWNQESGIDTREGFWGSPNPGTSRSARFSETWQNEFEGPQVPGLPIAWRSGVAITYGAAEVSFRNLLNNRMLRECFLPA
jgi:hypothetical protein